MTWREELVQWQERAKLNQAEAAEKLGVNLRTYQGWVLKKERAPKAFIQQLIRQTFLRN